MLFVGKTHGAQNPQKPMSIKLQRNPRKDRNQFRIRKRGVLPTGPPLPSFVEPKHWKTQPSQNVAKRCCNGDIWGGRDVSFRNTHGETLVSSPRPSRKVGGKRYPRVTSDLVATQRGDVYDTSFFYVESCVVKHCRNKFKNALMFLEDEWVQIKSTGHLISWGKIKDCKIWILPRQVKPTIQRDFPTCWEFLTTKWKLLERKTSGRLNYKVFKHEFQQFQ